MGLTAMSTTKAFDEVIDFIAAGSTPDEVASFRPSEATRERVADLIRLEKGPGHSTDEAAELSKYLQLEHIMRLAKARAQRHLGHE
jgi:hypothetical protein